MMAVFEEVVAPAARRFQPDIILVSISPQQHASPWGVGSEHYACFSPCPCVGCCHPTKGRACIQCSRSSATPAGSGPGQSSCWAQQPVTQLMPL